MDEHCYDFAQAIRTKDGLEHAKVMAIAILRMFTKEDRAEIVAKAIHHDKGKVCQE